MEELFRPKEISWLYFNERVLQEAENKSVPLIERLRFLGIYSNNLDEFFRVRVATLKRLSLIGKKAVEILGDDPRNILKEINEIVLDQHIRFEAAFLNLLSDFAKRNVYIVNERQLNKEQEKFVDDYFQQNVRLHLMPMMLDQVTSDTKLKDAAIYLAVCMNNKKENKNNYALIEVPASTLPRFVKLPSDTGKHYFIVLDDIIRFGLKDFFGYYKFDTISAFTIKVTRDAELDIHDDISDGYIKNVTRSIQKRKEGNPVRFVYDETIPKNLLDILIKKLKYRNDDALIPGGRYHNFKDFIKFPLLFSDMAYEPLKPIEHPDLPRKKNYFTILSEKEILLYYPYHSFNNFIEFLKQASIDPKVKDIKITLYRLAKKSIIVETLLNAIRNGKSVTTIVELQARFDEEANIEWAETLKSEGVKVIYGVHGIKVHSKLCMITRKENKTFVRYACIGTGNFNEDTARVYTDAMLMTSDKKIINEVAKVFDFFNLNYKLKAFNHLIVSPFNMRNSIKRLIKKEITNSKAKKKSYIYLKINNLADPEIIDLLYQANQAGVDVRLSVRGMFSLVTELKKKSDRIQARAILDRYLEHTRIYIFCNGGNEKVYISSADLLTRNIDRRVEVTCPVYDEKLKQQLLDIFNIQWNDNVKARILDKNLKNKLVENNNEKIRSQVEVYDYLKKLANTK